MSFSTSMGPPPTWRRRPFPRFIPDDDTPSLRAPTTRRCCRRSPTNSVSAPAPSVEPPRPPRPRPVGLQIDTVDVARFRCAPSDSNPTASWRMSDETEIGWYQYGATAGRPGATVLAAHVNWNRTPGPFARLGTVDPGARRRRCARRWISAAVRGRRAGDLRQAGAPPEIGCGATRAPRSWC